MCESGENLRPDYEVGGQQVDGAETCSQLERVQGRIDALAATEACSQLDRVVEDDDDDEGQKDEDEGRTRRPKGRRAPESLH